MKARNMTRFALTGAAASGVLLAATAEAAFVEYDSLSSFIAASGATNATGSLNEPPTVSGSNYTWGSVTVSVAPGSGMATLGANWTSLLPSEFALSGSENLDYIFAAPVYAAGFRFVEPGTSPFIDSVFRITLLNGTEAIHQFDVSPPNDVATFIGVTSHLAFTRMQVREIVGSIDNEFFGEVYTSTVPAPAAAAVLATILGLGRRRR